MAVETIGLIAITSMFILMVLRIPIAIAMGVPALFGIMYLKGMGTLSAAIESIVWTHSTNYALSTIPMFILMGELLFVAGITNELFTTFRAWFGRLRGGLGMATIAASAGFAAASGSSIATTGTMGVITSKEMLKAGYAKTLTGGSIVAGGTLGILIPPSTILILYGMLTGESIGKLLIAGIFPGILLTLFFILTIAITVKMNPHLAPTGESSTWSERIYSLRHTIWIIVLFAVVIGGMYLGWFSPTEAAGIGALGALIIALIRQKLTWGNLIEVFSNTLKTTGFLFAIVLGSFLLNYFLVITRLPNLIATFIKDSGLSPGVIFLLIIIMYLILGAIMDSLSMIVITIPILLPIIQGMGFDLIWFGIIIVLVVEAGLITPPVGMNCFVLNGVAPELKIEEIFKGALRFVIPILVLVTLLYFIPEIVLYLPSRMF
ncbi:TRAP transporter large permease [Neobacillus sp. SAB-20_R2A]|uniref:TRAP transporter large permease n=1 Tax=Neobacillus sp. SAB-20_R2A TaxID=3120519 RepID=UPI003C6E3DE3